MRRHVAFTMVAGLLTCAALAGGEPSTTRIKDGIVRGNPHRKAIALLFTGDSYAEGGNAILDTLEQHRVRASFFLTGNFLRNPQFEALIRRIVKAGHYLGPHSDRHLLYLSWSENRLLVSKEEFTQDMKANLREMARFGADLSRIRYWVPPYEHYNETIVQWSRDLRLTLINYSPGTVSHADYTGEQDNNYRSSQRIFDSILKKEKEDPNGLNGFLLLMHVGAGDARKDKFHLMLPQLLDFLKNRGYVLLRVDQLLDPVE